MNSVIVMRPDYRLLAGIAIPIVFGFSILVLATLVDGYSHVSQTVSEIGDTGSAAEIPWWHPRNEPLQIPHVPKGRMKKVHLHWPLHLSQSP